MLFLSFGVASFTRETASRNRLLEVSKSRTPQLLRLFPYLQLTRRRIAESVACALSPVQDYSTLLPYLYGDWRRQPELARGANVLISPT